MATVGEILKAPEAGWKRINLTLDNVTYGGGTDSYNYGANTAYLGDTLRLNVYGAWVSFKFSGDKIRIIGTRATQYDDNVKINIDGVDSYFSERGNVNYAWQTLVFEKTGLSEGEHTVTITRVSYVDYNEQVHIDAIDVAEGEIIPAPTNLIATPGDSQVTLNWNVVTDATGYNVKRSTTAGGPYETIASNVSGTSYVDTNIVNGTTYYYVITAITADGESGNSNEASATPQAAPVEEGQGLLRVTMIDSSEREYQLSDSEINGFITWHQNHVSTDVASYMLKKKVGLQSSKEYLTFDKIISFEVIPLPTE
ncbi:hypothetical protein P22_2879 [Propionispora sp. 2/2-37]|uniref:fibronectin type III domain-containing protein n=1 Tax=Propionispora sp. 2/2-37 TaxID=1677858 RepID=UPI0006BB6ACC|nr:fibronectin type III domain-containing protein [Propionispora sp. 2/2-37]CUH96768.1 hypothetical protein P22_2879 [Propionispora sp. 2/2-37]